MSLMKTRRIIHSSIGFAVPDADVVGLDLEGYLARVKNALAAVPGVSNAKADVIFRTGSQVLRPQSLRPPLMAGWFFPEAKAFRVAFSLTIAPPGASGDDSSDKEPTVVGFDIFPTSLGIPVAFIEIASLGTAPSPWFAAYQAQLHLTLSLSPLTGGQVAAATMTATPLSIDTVFGSGSDGFEDNPDAGLAWKYEPDRSGDALEVQWNPAVVPSELEALQRYKVQASQELCLVFRAYREQEVFRVQWESLLSRLRKLADAVSQAGFWSRLWRFFSWSPETGALVKRIVDMRLSDSQARAELNSHYSLLAAGRAQGFIFKGVMDRFFETRQEFGFDDAMDLVRFIESRCEQSLAVFVSVIMGLLGALLGLWVGLATAGG